MNQVLKNELQDKFGPLGIVAWSGCCRWGCTGSYDEFAKEEFESRENGIYYIRLHLSGMNYNSEVTSCGVSYCSKEGDPHQYLMEHWDDEIKLLVSFCQILGLGKGDYTITKPGNSNLNVMINFTPPLVLESVPESDSDNLHVR